jgi:L-ribulose-5-phosphate 4-epimerase
MRIIFRGAIPATEEMQACEIESEYEWNTGQVIIRRFANLDPLETPGVLVSGHAPFCWGRSPGEAAHTAVVVEELAHTAYLTVTLRADLKGISETLRDKHFSRKHGPGAYYGQKAAV